MTRVSSAGERRACSASTSHAPARHTEEPCWGVVYFNVVKVLSHEVFLSLTKATGSTRTGINTPSPGARKKTSPLTLERAGRARRHYARPPVCKDSYAQVTHLFAYNRSTEDSPGPPPPSRERAVDLHVSVTLLSGERLNPGSR